MPLRGEACCQAPQCSPQWHSLLPVRRVQRTRGDARAGHDGGCILARVQLEGAERSAEEMRALEERKKRQSLEWQHALAGPRKTPPL